MNAFLKLCISYVGQSRFGIKFMPFSQLIKNINYSNHSLIITLNLDLFQNYLSDMFIAQYKFVK